MLVAMNARILLVEDESAIREMVAFNLADAGYQTTQAGDVEEARLRLAEALPDMILLDWMLPEISGADFLRSLRRHESWREIPVIMLTARGEERDILKAFEAGADDYVVKPFSARELLARVRAVLRRSAPQTSGEVLSAGDLQLDPASHAISVTGEKLHTGPTEFRLLQFFMAHPNRVYSRAQLIDQVWGTQAYIEERTVDVHVKRLRQTLADSGYDAWIQTVRGVGYRFSAPE